MRGRKGTFMEGGSWERRGPEDEEIQVGGRRDKGASCKGDGREGGGRSMRGMRVGRRRVDELTIGTIALMACWY